MWNKEGAWGTPSPNAKPPEDSQKGHDAGPIGGNGSCAGEMRKQNNFVIKQQHINPRHAGQGERLRTHADSG